MPTAATSQSGPQAVGSYTYPQGQRDNYGYEWIYRRAWVTDDNTTPDMVHTFEVTDGKGGLPIKDQPKKKDYGMPGVVQYHTKFTLPFTRRVGDTGPYQECLPTPDAPPGPGQPHTLAQ